MGYILDLIVISIIAVSVFLAYKRGFINSLIGVIGIVVSIILSLAVAPPIADALYSAAFEKGVLATAEASIERSVEISEDATTGAVNGIYSKMPSFVSKYAVDNGYSPEEVASKVLSGEIDSRMIASEVCNSVIDPAIISILKYLLVIILFFPFLLLSRLFSRFVSALIRKNILGKLNALLGGAIGLLRGIALAIIFCLAISLLANLFGIDWLGAAVESTTLTSFILGLFPFSF